MAGPALIVAGVLFLLRDVLFRGVLPVRWTDVLALWLPTHCLMGKSLAAGHILSWNPHVMTGVQFAADPQSGWMNLPVMALYAALPCHVAIRWYIAFQPLAGGLGLYAFLRTEGLSRAAASVGGLALSLVIAGSDVAFNLPFSASLAWTAVLLAAAARFVRAKRWSARLLWLLAMAVAWGQVAAALLTNGVALATLALAAYLAVRLSTDVRDRTRAGRQALAIGSLTVLALPLVNLAYLWPRLAYLPATSIGLGYRGIDAVSRRLAGAGSAVPPFRGGFPPPWPLRLALSPGVYLGATALILSVGAWRSTRHRRLALTFAVFGLASYLLSLTAVANLLRSPLGSTTAGQAYLHDPLRFAYGLLLAVPVLAAAGTDAALDSKALRDVALVLAPGLLLWMALPPLFGAEAARLLPMAIGAVAIVVAAWVVVRRPAVAVLIPAVLAADLIVNGVLQQARNEPAPQGQSVLTPNFPPGGAPISLARYTSPGPIVRWLQAHPGGRFVSLDPSRWTVHGYVLAQQPEDWGLMATQRSMLFGLEEAQGYNSVQPRRYWEYVRAASAKPIMYNVSYFAAVTRPMLELLRVGWIVGPKESPPPFSDPAPAAIEGQWAVYRVRDPVPRATVATTWRTEAGSGGALRAVTASRFDPRAEAVLERGSGPAHSVAPTGPARPGVVAVYRSLGPQSAEIIVNAPTRAVLVIRTSFDPRWRATVDGRRVPLFPADFFLQGARVPPGRHVVTLRYDDPTIGYGLAGSAVAIAVLLGAAAVARRRVAVGGEARRRRVTQSPADAGRDEREADPVAGGARVPAGSGGGLLRRGRLRPRGGDGGQDAR